MNKDNTAFQIKVAQWVEVSILSVFVLISRIFQTWFDFIFRPDNFSSFIISSDPLEESFSSNYSRPLTYFLFSNIAIILVFPQTVGSQNLNNEYLNLILETLKSGDLVGTLVAISPFILWLGLNSLSLMLVSLMSKNSLTFNESIYVISYMIGSIFILGTLVCPIFYRLDISSIFSFFAFIFLFILLFRIYYSSIVLLSYELDCNKTKSFLILLFSGIIFTPMYWLVILWGMPIVV